MDSSSSTCGSSPPFEEEHDVFISFNGETRRGFTSHLLGALRRRKIRACVDDKMKRGKYIPSALVAAIHQAIVSLIVFSENYAKSKACLVEATEIIGCKITRGQIVLPIFYHIEPGVVGNQTEGYADAFAEHEICNLLNLEKVERWRTALRTAADLSGWHCRETDSRTEYELVEEIADSVMQMVNRKRKHKIEAEQEIGTANHEHEHERKDLEIANDVIQIDDRERKQMPEARINLEIANELMQKLDHESKHILQTRKGSEISNDMVQKVNIGKQKHLLKTRKYLEREERMLHELYKENILTVVQTLHLWENAKSAWQKLHPS